MVYIIYLDINGKELSRREKGRGRPPLEQDAEGNYIVREKLPTTATIVTTIAPDGSQVKTNVLPPIVEKNASKERIDVPVAKEKVMAAMCPFRTSTRGNVMVLIGPVVVQKTGITNLPPDNLQPMYKKIEIDSDTKTVSIWNLCNQGETADVVYENAIV